MSTPQLVLYASLYLAGFGVVHSVFSMDLVKDMAKRVMGRGFAFYRLIYSLFQFAIMAGYIVIFEPYDSLLYRMPQPWMAIAITVGLLGVGLILWCLFVMFDGLEFMGIRQIAALWGGREPDTDIPLRTDGPFAWCRHPVYLGTLISFGASPYMTVIQMVFVVFVLVYAVVGSIPEERRLLAIYGQEYADYQKRTKRLIPFVI